MVYQTENTLEELGDKITEEEKGKVEEKLEALKESLEGEDIEEIKAKTEELTQEFYAISEKMYADVGGQGAEDSSEEDDDVVDADYEVMDDE